MIKEKCKIEAHYRLYKKVSRKNLNPKEVLLQQDYKINIFQNSLIHKEHPESSH